TILCADIRTLAVQLRGIMCYKECGEQFIIRNFGRIVYNITRLGMPCSARSDMPISGIANMTACIAGYHSGYTVQLLELFFHTPEAACCKCSGIGCQIPNLMIIHGV